MANYIKSLKEGSDIIYPRTKTKAVAYDTGRTVSAVLNEIDDGIEQIEDAETYLSDLIGSE